MIINQRIEADKPQFIFHEENFGDRKGYKISFFNKSKIYPFMEVCLEQEEFQIFVKKFKEFLIKINHKGEENG
jgi:hypothetical protein